MSAPVTRPIRFGVVAPVLTDMRTWRDRVRRIADHGYSTLLMPDVPRWQPAPAPTLAMAAADTGLRVGTWVYASPLRPPVAMAWEAHSMTVLTEGRFELGIGTGRPDLEDDIREWQRPVVPPATRLADVRETVTLLREMDGAERHTPVVMAVRGPKARALARELADTATIVNQPDDSRADVAAVAHELLADRDVELAAHIPVVGDTIESFMTAVSATDLDALRAADSLAILPGDPAAAVDELLRRREEIGYTYFVIGGDSADAMAPVVAQLAGT